MKKITLALATAFTFVNTAFSQVNITIQAPPANTTTQLRAPNGTKDQAYLRGAYLIRASELTALYPGIQINQIGFILDDGTSLAVTGALTIYMENSSANT